MSIIFLTKEAVRELHNEAIEAYGGSLGLRDQGLLESAVTQPQSSFGGEYLYTDVFDMASVYFFNLIKNHAFLDGNKRVGVSASLVFLELNGYTIGEEHTQELYDLAIQVASSSSNREEVREWLRSHATPISDPSTCPPSPQ